MENTPQPDFVTKYTTKKHKTLQFNYYCEDNKKCENFSSKKGRQITCVRPPRLVVG